ncbi:Mini-ribonuclease 3 [Erysipelothrix sp. HDW6A]|uniref:Mini-ribonuclease 3 n=1 Tax=Erysipelothrix sp. HDW6A TaxID=2714928 RepID=UPI001F111CF3|nr:ribonuclease III domain-containing protein [Erysipelothrix sp. HDW6A]
MVNIGITKTKQLQETSIKYVSAKGQANFIMMLIDKEILNEDELAIFRRGRNAKSASMAKNADVTTYRIATGFEAVWGYLYMEKYHERLNQLWTMFIDFVEE